MIHKSHGALRLGCVLLGYCPNLRDIDMLDGTPALDLKPYVAYSDALFKAHKRRMRREIKGLENCSGYRASQPAAAHPDAESFKAHRKFHRAFAHVTANVICHEA